ncbi:kinase-like protein [Hyaloscypha variabilis]
MRPGEPVQIEIVKDPKIVGESGRHYLIEQILQQKGNSPHRVSLASAGNEKFILKDVPSAQFDYIRGIYPQPLDTLRGLAALHERNIVHTDVKANNILVDWDKGDHGISIKQVKLADIEDATRVDPNSDIVGIQVGNLMWRSPESHTQARVNKPSDIFSFGIVCIYVMTRRIIFKVEEEDLEEGAVEPLAVILERQISYFADEEGLNAFLKYLGDSPWCHVLEVLRDGFNKTNPRKPVTLWKGIDEDFRDLITGLTKFDPAQRLTANEALRHRWFEDVE